jgi:PAS domain S-box-containing protein
MRAGRPLDAAGRLLYSFNGAGFLFGLFLLSLLGLMVTGNRAPVGTLMAAGAAAIATVLGAAWCMRRERLRAGIASSTERAREQAVLHDELDQRLAVQKRLRESDARLGAIVESAPVALFATDLEGAITFSAGVGPDPLGKQPGEAAGWSAFELFADQAKVVERLRGALSGATSQIDLALGERVFTLRLAPFRDAGKTVGAIVVAVDITDREHAELALRRTVETLKQVDGERRALLARLVNAQEEERRHIAADIHDDSVQSMFAVGVRLLTLRSALRDPAQVELVNRLQEAVQQASDRLRHLVFELRPAALDEGGLASALREYLDVMKAESGLEVELSTTLVPQPASEVEVIAYRIAQEALVNVRKHSRARRVLCEVSMVDGGIQTRIRDDGLGFNAREMGTKPGHLGLVAMRERAELAGGWLRLESQPGHGCVVEYWIPKTTTEATRAA